MNTLFCRLCPAFLLVAAGVGLAAAPAVKKAPAKPATDVQEFVFLGEARPILIRMHVRVDGKTVHAAWDEFMKSLFAYLDVNGDGVLSKEEAEVAPSVGQIRDGGIPPNAGVRGGRTATKPTMKDLDADQDGKVTLAEMAAYYRKNGLVPFQVQLAAAQPTPVGAMAFFGGGQDPSADEISKAIFTLLDTNKDGNLSKEELAAAPAVLLKRDENEDEIVTIRELVPKAKSSVAMFGKAMMGGPAKRGPTTNKTLLSIARPGQAPVDLVRSMQERYGPRGKFSEKIQLGRKDLGLDEATFALLDVNGDGVLDEKELEAFVKRAPDLELVVRLGTTGAAEARVELVAPRQGLAPLAGKVRITSEAAMVNLGATRAEVRTSEEEDPYDTFGAIIRTQYAAQFSAADKDGKGYLTEKDLKGNRLFGAQFKAMDRDGDGKLTLKEVNAYLDAYRKIQLDAAASCVSLVFADESRGLFDLLDVDGDKRLSVREMRGAVGLLEQFDRERKGYLTRADIPRSYQLTLRRGAMDEGGAQLKAFAAIYGGGQAKRERRLTAGPLWFRKMDRNRDGDVSRKEFLFSDELFRKIDTDGDGLISVEEAERYDALLRKQK